MQEVNNAKQADEKTTAQYIKMTETPVTKLILMLGIPTTISMLVTSIYNMADTYFVGQIGTSASGAVGVVFGLMAIIQAFGFMFGHGAGSKISRLLGQRDTKTAGKYASTGFFAGLGLRACTFNEENGMPELSLNNDLTIGCFDLMREMLFENDGVYIIGKSYIF